MPLFPRPAAADGGGRQTQTQTAAVAFFPPSQSSQNPLSLLQARVKDLETSFRSWLDRQPLPVEAAVVTATNALQGAAIGGLMGTFSPTFPTDPNAAAGLDIQAVASLKQAQRPPTSYEVRPRDGDERANTSLMLYGMIVAYSLLEMIHVDEPEEEEKEANT